MKKLIFISAFIVLSLGAAAQAQTINAGESGAAVRNKLNEMFSTLFSKTVFMQFSANGVTDWHSNYQPFDNYFRVSYDQGNTWGAAVPIASEYMVITALTVDTLFLPNDTITGNLVRLKDSLTVFVTPHQLNQRLENLEIPGGDQQTLSIINDSLFITNGNAVSLEPYLTTDYQNLGLGAKTGTQQAITITGGTGILLDLADNDNDPQNEAQALSLGTTAGNPVINLSQVNSQAGGNITLRSTGAASLSASGDTLTINATSGDVINAFFNTIPVTSTTLSVTYPGTFPGAYFLNVNAWYNKTIDGKDVRIQNAVYDFSKNNSGFSLKLDTLAGYIEYLAVDTVNIFPVTFDDSNYATADHTHAGVYQPLDGDLTSIAGLAGTSGFLKKTAADTYTLDTNTYLTGNQTITLSGAVTGSGTTGISTTLSDNTATYAKIGADLKTANTVSSTVDLSAGGIGNVTLSANTAFTFTNFQLNKTYLLIVNANNYTASFAQGSKHIAVEGNATIGTTGIYYISLTCIDATSGSEKLLTVIMKGA